MANPSGAFGLRPVRKLDGSPWNANLVRAYVSASYGTALYIGDPVLYTPTSAEKDATGKYPTINRSAGTSGIIIRGVVVGFEPLRTDLSKVHNATSTERWAIITPPDPGIVYHIRDDGTGAPAATWPGKNAVCVAGSGGSTTTGLSSFALDAGGTTAPTTTQAFPLHILGLADIENNELADYAVWEVVLNTCFNATGLVLGIDVA